MIDAFSNDTLEHRCSAGHYWREHTNGQVTPSWGLGGTFIDIEDPSRCPAPATDENGLYECGSCRQRHRPGDGIRSLSFSPWEYGEQEGKRRECEIPRPACGAEAVWTRRWGDRHLPWGDEGPGALYSIWRLEQRDSGQRLVCYLGGSVEGGTEAVDVHTGEVLRIPTGATEWNPAGTRKATLADLPEALRRDWPKPKSASERGVETLWLLARTNPDYQALLVLHAKGLLQVDDHARQFMWAVKDAGGPHGLAAEIHRRVTEREWQVADLDALLAAHRRERARLAAEQARDTPAPDVQLTLGI
jgi:hypothetical protein